MSDIDTDKKNAKVKFRLVKTKKRKFANDLNKEKVEANVHRTLEQTVNMCDENNGN